MKLQHYLIRAAEDGGYYIRKAEPLNGGHGVNYGPIVFAGNIHTCFAYLRKVLTESE